MLTEKWNVLIVHSQQTSPSQKIFLHGKHITKQETLDFKSFPILFQLQYKLRVVYRFCPFTQQEYNDNRISTFSTSFLKFNCLAKMKGTGAVSYKCVTSSSALLS